MITRVDAVTQDLRLLQPQTMGDVQALGTQPCLFVRVWDEDGNSGIGECSSWPIFSGQSARGLETLLWDVLVPQVLGRDEAPWAGLASRLHRVVRGNLTVKAALETAILDLVSRRAGLTLAALLGGDASRPIGLSWSVSLQDVVAEREQVAELYASGFRAFKLKAGVLPPSDDVARLLMLGETAPDAILRLDYNETATVPALRAIAGPARELGVDYIEQPYPAGHEERLTDLGRWLGVPIALDESITRPSDLVRAATHHWCDYVSVKCAKVGGPLQMSRMMQLALDLGITPYAGAYSETRLGIAAAHSAWTTVPTAAYGSDFYFPGAIMDDSEVTGTGVAEGGHRSLSAAPGHGCEIPEAWWVAGRTEGASR